MSLPEFFSKLDTNKQRLSILLYPDEQLTNEIFAVRFCINGSGFMHMFLELCTKEFIDESEEGINTDFALYIEENEQVFLNDIVFTFIEKFSKKHHYRTEPKVRAFTEYVVSFDTFEFVYNALAINKIWYRTKYAPEFVALLAADNSISKEKMQGFVDLYPPYNEKLL